MSKQKHHQLHNWLPNQEEWYEPPEWRLSPGGRALSRRRKDEEMKGERKRHREGGTTPFLLYVSLPSCFYGTKLLKASVIPQVF